LPWIGGVLDNPVGVHQVKGVIGEWQAFPVGDLEPAREALLGEVGARQLDGRRGEIDAGDVGAALREPGQVDPGATADFKNRSAAIAVKVHESEQVMQFFEVILVEIVEEAARADGMPRNLQVVNVPVPVLTDLRRRRHLTTIYTSYQLSAISCQLRAFRKCFS
jgi:hypothetical protein